MYMYIYIYTYIYVNAFFPCFLNIKSDSDLAIASLATRK